MWKSLIKEYLAFKIHDDILMWTYYIRSKSVLKIWIHNTGRDQDWPCAKSLSVGSTLINSSSERRNMAWTSSLFSVCVKEQKREQAGWIYISTPSCLVTFHHRLVCLSAKWLPTRITIPSDCFIIFMFFHPEMMTKGENILSSMSWVIIQEIVSTLLDPLIIPILSNR